MLSKVRQRCTSAHLIALMALFLALSGTSYAAAKLVIPKNSVGSTQVKKNAITSSKVKDGSLKKVDFKAGELPKGDTGATGATGAQGPKGDTGAAGADGTALAYARVQANGTLLPVTNTATFGEQSKRVADANITNPSAGVYCFSGLNFLPHSAVVSSDNAGASAATQNNFVLSVAIERGAGLGGCPADTQARVVSTTWTDAAAPANANHGFIIWFQ